MKKIEDEIAHCRVGDGTIQASLLLLDEEVKVGDYLLIHAGFAIRRLDENDAMQTLELMKEALQATSGQSSALGLV